MNVLHPVLFEKSASQIAVKNSMMDLWTVFPPKHHFLSFASCMVPLGTSGRKELENLRLSGFLHT